MTTHQTDSYTFASRAGGPHGVVKARVLIVGARDRPAAESLARAYMPPGYVMGGKLRAGVTPAEAAGSYGFDLIIAA